MGVKTNFSKGEKVKRPRPFINRQRIEQPRHMATRDWQQTKKKKEITVIYTYKLIYVYICTYDKTVVHVF